MLYADRYGEWLGLRILKPSHSSYLSAYEDGTECSETVTYKIQMLGNYPEESIQHSEHSKSLKSRYSKILKPSHSSHLSAYEDGTVCSRTSAYKIQMPGNYPEESIKLSEHGKSLKSRILRPCLLHHHILQLWTVSFNTHALMQWIWLY